MQLLLAYRGSRLAIYCGYSTDTYYSEGTELVRAYVVPAGKSVTTESIEEFIRTQLAKYKWLTGGVVFVESIPKSPSGKILRRYFRDLVKEQSSQRRVMARL